MKIYICETQAQAVQLIAQWGEDKVIDIGAGPFEDVVIREQDKDAVSPKTVRNYLGLKRQVLIFKD
jgi:hypothetical protein